LQNRQSELDSVEVKAARRGTPKRLYEALSAFANQTGGGVILFGLDEFPHFSILPKPLLFKHILTTQAAPTYLLE